jgi:hypothetical protein
MTCMTTSSSWFCTYIQPRNIVHLNYENDLWIHRNTLGNSPSITSVDPGILGALCSPHHCPAGAGRRDSGSAPRTAARTRRRRTEGVRPCPWAVEPVPASARTAGRAAQACRRMGLPVCDVVASRRWRRRAPLQAERQRRRRSPRSRPRRGPSVV